MGISTAFQNVFQEARVTVGESCPRSLSSLGLAFFQWLVNGRVFNGPWGHKDAAGAVRETN